LLRGEPRVATRAWEAAHIRNGRDIMRGQQPQELVPGPSGVANGPDS
jgi:hypothetical protein